MDTYGWVKNNIVDIKRKNMLFEFHYELFWSIVHRTLPPPVFRLLNDFLVYGFFPPPFRKS